MSLEAGGGWTEPTDEEIEDHLVKEARRLLVQGEAFHTREETDYHKDGPTAWREIRRGPDTLATLPFEARREADLMAMAPALAALVIKLSEELETLRPPPAPEVPQPAVAHILQFFAYAHLPAALQAHSRPFEALARKIAAGSSNPETTVALRKLLEAKDAAVRARLAKP
jgi:hypothetical protein